MNTRTYHITIIIAFVVALFSAAFCEAIVLIAWTFQLMHLIFTYLHFSKSRYKGSLERLKRENYLKSGVSIIKPLHGNFPNLECNLESFFQLQYPTFELIFCVEDNEDSALKVIEKLQKKYPKVVTIISEGIENIGINPKVCNIATGYKNATYDLLWIADANIVASDIALQDMVHKCVDGYPLVHQLPWGVSGPDVSPTLGSISLGSILERWYFATAHSRPYMVINKAVCTCLNGMSNMISKSHFENIGGLTKFASHLNEDSVMGLAFDTHGYETIISKYPAIQNFDSFDITQYIDRRVRWTKLRNKYSHIAKLTPFEPIVDNHLVSWLCVFMLVGLHETGHIYHIWLHSALWLVVDAVVFMLIDRSIGLPAKWQCKNSQEYFFDWGRISNKPRGVYFFCINLIEHYLMWLCREFTSVFIYIKALQNTEHIIWKEKELKISESTESKDIKKE